MSDDKDAEIRRLRDRLDRLERTTESKARPRVGTGNRIALPIIGLAVVGGLVLTLAECSGTGVSQYDDSGSSWTPPSGYTVFPEARGRGAVATDWSEASREECGSSRRARCWAINVITEKDCPRGLYAAITILSDAGQNVDWTNDTALGVRAGEVTRLIFTTYERGDLTARLAEVNCR